MSDQERMDRAFKLAGEAFLDRLREKRPEDERELREVRNGEVVNVTGSFDHMHRVLEATGVPFTSVSPGEVARLDWDRLLVLLVNCPGQLPAEARERVAAWVRHGGYLLTTDWALKHLLEPAFPGRVEHNGREVPDCVVRVSHEGDSALLSGFLEDGREALWWMEASSFPCRVLDPAVRVLVRSPVVGERYGADAVVVEWDEGEGRVVHLVSHLYLQRSETRTRRDAMPAAAFLEDAGFGRERAELLAAKAGDLRASELKSAYTTAGFAAELVLDRKRKAAGAGARAPQKG